MATVTARLASIIRVSMALLAVGSLGVVFAGTAGAAGKPASSVSPRGHVHPKGHLVALAGKSPKCERGARVRVGVRLRQAGAAGTGTWSARCVGKRQTWEVVVRGRAGTFEAGPATVRLRTTVQGRKGRKSLRLTTRKIRLLESRGPLKGGDWSYGTFIFALGEGVHIDVTGGGGGTSLCTTDETVTSLTTTEDVQPVRVAIKTKASGACWNEHSWSRFHVEASGAGVDGSGSATLGQFEGDPPFLGYGFDCRYDWYRRPDRDWNGLKCERTDRYTVKITRP